MNLKKEFVQLEKSAVKLTVTIAEEDVKNAYNNTLKKYIKNAQIPGFRKGHVPQNVLERKYGDGIKSDAAAELIDASLNEIFQDENEKENRPLPYAQPAIENIPEIDVSKELTYTVTYDVFPKVSISNFSGIDIQEVQVEIGEKELSEELKSIQERNAVVIDKKDGEAVAKDDIVTINYCELGEDGNVIEGTNREDFVFTVGSGRNIFKIDDDIIGLKKDEEKEITKTYANDDPDTDLAGKTKKIKVKVTAIKERNLPALDDDLAQDVNEKYKTLEDLKNDIKKIWK